MRFVLVVVALTLGVRAAHSQVPTVSTVPRTDWGTFNFERERGATTGTISGPADSVFAKLPALLKELGIEIKEQDPVARVLQVRRQRLYQKLGRERVSASLGCGDGLTGPNADNYYVYATVAIQLTALPGGKTGFGMHLNAEAIDVPGGQTERVPCASTGKLELRLAQRLQLLFPG